MLRTNLFWVSFARLHSFSELFSVQLTEFVTSAAVAFLRELDSDPVLGLLTNCVSGFTHGGALLLFGVHNGASLGHLTVGTPACGPGGFCGSLRSPAPGEGAAVDLSFRFRAFRCYRFASYRIRLHGLHLRHRVASTSEGGFRKVCSSAHLECKYLRKHGGSTYGDCVFRALDYSKSEGHLGKKTFAEPGDVEAAVVFLVETVESPRQAMVANKIRLLEQMILLVHNICREEKETKVNFHRLYNKGMDRQILAEYVANFEAMKLGWASARSARSSQRRQIFALGN